MVIKNTLYWAPLLALLIGIEACQTQSVHVPSEPPTRPSVSRGESPDTLSQPPMTNSSLGATPPRIETATGTLPVEVNRNPKQKVAIIFGPAGFGSFSYAGFLEEVQRAKLDVVSLGGIEWGALLAALYSRKPLPFEAEWQVLKLKTDSRIEKYLKEIFGASKVEESPLPFACPAYDLNRRKAFLLHKGYYSELLLYCMPTLPLMSAYRNTVAHLTELESLVEYAQTKGAEKIIFVQAEPAAGQSAFDPTENSANAFWLLALDALKAKVKEPIEMCTIPLAKNFSAFEDRQNMINLGKEKANECIRRMFTRP